MATNGADHVAHIEPGTKVEVRSGFEGTWSRGFAVVEIVGGRYRLRRRSDSTELPTLFGPDDVRVEHHRSMWWV